jgi:acyl carrier protein
MRRAGDTSSNNALRRRQWRTAWLGLTGMDACALMPRVSNTVTRLLELCARRFDKKPTELRAEDDVFESLGIDSMQVLSLLSEVELQFNVEIPDYELRDVRSFSQLAECIERRL